MSYSSSIGARRFWATGCAWRCSWIRSRLGRAGDSRRGVHPLVLGRLLLGCAAGGVAPGDVAVCLLPQRPQGDPRGAAPPGRLVPVPGVPAGPVPMRRKRGGPAEVRLRPARGNPGAAGRDRWRPERLQASGRTTTRRRSQAARPLCCGTARSSGGSRGPGAPWRRAVSTCAEWSLAISRLLPKRWPGVGEREPVIGTGRCCPGTWPRPW